MVEDLIVKDSADNAIGPDLLMVAGTLKFFEEALFSLVAGHQPFADEVPVLTESPSSTPIEVDLPKNLAVNRKTKGKTTKPTGKDTLFITLQPDVLPPTPQRGVVAWKTVMGRKNRVPKHSAEKVNSTLVGKTRERVRLPRPSSATAVLIKVAEGSSYADTVSAVLRGS
ncbi:Hypothetical protein CINCED_3A007628 [Cinara cedri]|uniref:Uncharacterized protein n=1 Tax=Cinara cedri TaxID=506608 RepID=A0A5E4N1H0_9HEMI|nr:Hypothetical protein CINCED_3A007628 [Cinara cedri]